MAKTKAISARRCTAVPMVGHECASGSAGILVNSREEIIGQLSMFARLTRVPVYEARE